MQHSDSQSAARQTEVAAQVSQKISCISLGTEQALRPVITVVFIYKICVHIDIWTNTFITNPHLRDRLSKVCSSPRKCALAGGARCIQDLQWLYRSLHEDVAVGSKSIKKLLFQLVIQSLVLQTILPNQDNTQVDCLFLSLIVEFGFRLPGMKRS